jgi:hypothetical protein
LRTKGGSKEKKQKAGFKLDFSQERKIKSLDVCENETDDNMIQTKKEKDVQEKNQK